MIKKVKLVFLLVIAIFTITSNNFADDIKIVQKSISITNTKPISVNGVQYIALRPIFEALEWKVTWNGSKKSILCIKDKDSIEFNAANNCVHINKQLEFMTVPMKIIKNSSYLPTQFIIDQFGVKIRWTGKDNIIITNRPDAVNEAINGRSNIIIAGNGLILNIFEPCSSETINDMVSYADNLLLHDNIEEAMSKYSEILENISREDTPDVYARVMNNHANALCKFADRDNSIAYIEKSISIYNDVLRIYESKKETDNIEIVKNNLGTQQLKLYELTGDRTSKSKALSLFKERLDYLNENKSSIEYAMTQYNIGTILRRDSVHESKASFEEAKRIFIEKLDTLALSKKNNLYPLICYNLGNIYGYELDNKYLQISLKYFDKALKIWTLEEHPLQYANIQVSIGHIYAYKYELNPSDEFLSKSNTYYEESLKVYTQKKYPNKYAQIKSNMR